MSRGRRWNSERPALRLNLTHRRSPWGDRCRARRQPVVGHRLMLGCQSGTALPRRVGVAASSFRAWERKQTSRALNAGSWFSMRGSTPWGSHNAQRARSVTRNLCAMLTQRTTRGRSSSPCRYWTKSQVGATSSTSGHLVRSSVPDFRVSWAFAGRIWLLLANVRRWRTAEATVCAPSAQMATLQK